jgi:hypothetical protein
VAPFQDLAECCHQPVGEAVRSARRCEGIVFSCSLPDFSLTFCNAAHVVSLLDVETFSSLDRCKFKWEVDLGLKGLGSIVRRSLKNAVLKMDASLRVCVVRLPRGTPGWDDHPLMNNDLAADQLIRPPRKSSR